MLQKMWSIEADQNMTNTSISNKLFRPKKPIDELLLIDDNDDNDWLKEAQDLIEMQRGKKW